LLSSGLKKLNSGVAMPFDFANPTPLRDAVGQLSAKTPIGSILRTAEWQQMPLALRQRAQFSAGVESVRVLQRIQDSLKDAISNARNETSVNPDRAVGTFKMDRQKFITEIRELAIKEGLIPADDALEGTLQDITSEARLDLIFRTQMQQARGFAYWKRGQKKNILDAFPAQELIRVEPRKEPRDWQVRWVEAGGEFHDSRMVALKTDPIWTRISRFGTPWPPFDFNSGMGLREIDRDEAVRLGVMTEESGPDGPEVAPVDEDFNSDLEASVKDLNPEFKDALKTLFGDQIEVSGEKVRWAA
jgi:hypothetical protein